MIFLVPFGEMEESARTFVANALQVVHTDLLPRKLGLKRCFERCLDILWMRVYATLTWSPTVTPQKCVADAILGLFHRCRLLIGINESYLSLNLCLLEVWGRVLTTDC